VSKTFGLNPDGETLTVQGAGFDPAGNIGTRPPLNGQAAGVYVVFGRYDTNWKPSAGAPASSRRIIKQIWALPEPAYSTFNPTGTDPGFALLNSDGTFSVNIDVAPSTTITAGNYGIFVYPGSGAVNAANEFERRVSFPTDPEISVSETTDLNPAGESLTVTGKGIDPTGNLGTRPPLNGQAAGVYVVFGRFDSNWRPSAAAPSSGRRIIKQIWAMPEPAYSTFNPTGTDPAFALLNSDGTFSVNIDVAPSTTITAGNYGIFVYPGSGAVNAANEFEQLINFLSAPSAPTITSATASEGQATVAWNAPSIDGGSPITGYEVTPYIGLDAQSPVTVDADTTSTTIDGLTNGTAYTFTVAAQNAIGTGEESAASEAVTPQWWLPWSTADAAITDISTWLTSEAPTTAQKSQWLTKLNSGEWLPGDLVASLRTGDDALKNVDPTVRLYSAYLTRVPDRSGLNFWLQRRRSDWTLYRISSHFAGSSEFKTRYGSLSNRSFVQQIYQNVFNRSADTAGLNYWTQKLDSGAVGRGQVMINFSESSEYKTKEANRVNAAAIYIHFLGRAPSLTERDELVDRLDDGDTVAEVVREMIHEPSFGDRAN